tara:strand:+ start:683 stop:1498 length:816 start_codon:yes stop_codon:yes gene_type:complete
MTSIKLDKENINKLIEISKKAGEAIMQIYRTDFEVEIKKDLSPLTQADILSHKIIHDSLSKMTPNIPILSEEFSDISFDERSTWKEYWLIDPLDGTKEFIKKNGEFTTNIALISNNKPVLGIIHVPSSNETYWGSEETGSYFLEGDSESDMIQLKVSNNTESPLRIVSSRSHISQDLKMLLKKLDNYELLSIGSSLKFCLIAKGEADCYPRLGPTCEWDIAAGDIIAQSAGADIVTLKNCPLKYNTKKEFLNPYFLVSNNIFNKEKILSLL